MSQVTLNVEPGVNVVADLKFEGIAKYSAYLFAPADNDRWVHVRTLVEDASSIDARPDVLFFDAPAAGMRLLFLLSAKMTAVTVPAGIGATAFFSQQDMKRGHASEEGRVETAFVNVVVRALLVSA